MGLLLAQEQVFQPTPKVRYLPVLPYQMSKTFTPQQIKETQRANALVERGMALLSTPSFTLSTDFLRWIEGGCK